MFNVNLLSNLIYFILLVVVVIFAFKIYKIIIKKNKKKNLPSDKNKTDDIYPLW